MTYPDRYICLSQNEFVHENYKIVPIRFEDRSVIMKWRNEQMYHLRQNKPLTELSQDEYFSGVVAGSFDKEMPDQILFSYLENGNCIGYGGLVHINWVDRNAEISFIMKTELENDDFHLHWSTYLKMIELLAFEELGLHKVYVYAFDLRPHLYEVLLESGYFLDAKLSDHCFFNERYIDVVIHSKLNYLK